MGTEKEQSLAMHGLKSAAGFVQTQVAGALDQPLCSPHHVCSRRGVKKSIEIARLIREENERLAADARAGREGTTPGCRPPMSPDPPPKDRRIARADDLQEWSGPRMPAITNKQQLLTAQNAQKEVSARRSPPAEPRPLLEELVYAICREGATPADADAAYARLLKTFIDWNEVRVSTVQEVGEILRPLSARERGRARIIGLLQEVFEASYTFDLGEIVKKGLKDTARKSASTRRGVNDYAVAWVVQRTLGGHAIHHEPTRACCRGLGSWRRWTPRASRRHAASIEHVIPKTRGPEFTDLRACMRRNCASRRTRGAPVSAQDRVPRRHREYAAEDRAEAEEVAIMVTTFAVLHVNGLSRLAGSGGPDEPALKCAYCTKMSAGRSGER